MDCRETANAFAALVKQGQHERAAELHWSEDIVSREAMEGPMAELSGREAVKAKSDWWTANHEVHDAKAEGPFVNGDRFAMIYELDVTPKATGQRMQMREVALYTVRDGKVAVEEFFY